MRSKGLRPSWLLAKERWPGGCQSWVASTWAKCRARRFTTGTMASPCGTASAPPGQKSFCASVTIRTSCRERCIGIGAGVGCSLLRRRGPVLRHQRAQLVLYQGLLLQEQARAALEDGAPALEDRLRAVEGGLDQRLDRQVNLARRGLAVGALVPALGRGSAEKAGVVGLVSDVAEPLDHAVARHHGARDVGDLLNIVGGAGRDLAKDQLLRRAAAQQHRHLVLELQPGHEEPVLGRALDRIDERVPGQIGDRDLVKAM